MVLLSNKELKFIRFNGTMDPCLHIYIYIYYEVSLITLDEEFYAKLFPLYLKGEA